MRRSLLVLVLAPIAAHAWWTPSPDGGLTWLDVSDTSINDHGYQAANTVDRLERDGSVAAAELRAFEDSYYYGVWAEDFVTGDSTADALMAAAHYWDGGEGAPVLAQSWYEAAVTAYRLGQREQAYEFLGRATHYVQDMTQPNHADQPLDPHHSGIMCLHQPWSGVEAWESHCHGVVEVYVAEREWTPVDVAIPSFTKKKQPGYAATEWARSVHGKGDRGVARGIERWHGAVAADDFDAVDADVPDLFGHSVAAAAGLVEAFWADTH